MLVQWSPAVAAAEMASSLTPNPQQTVTRIEEMESTCASRARATGPTGTPESLFTRLGGEVRIHIITREMVRLHLQNPTLSRIVGKYNPDYLADMIARYVITATGGPVRYQGEPLSETHAHLHITNGQFLSGGTDFVEAMRNVGASEEDILDTICLLGGLRSQIVSR